MRDVFFILLIILAIVLGHYDAAMLLTVLYGFCVMIWTLVAFLKWMFRPRT